MNKELTLSLDANIVDFAHTFSEQVHKPVSRIIEDYFSDLRTKTEPVMKQNPASAEIPHNVVELYGILEGIDVPDKKEMRRMFHEDHLD